MLSYQMPLLEIGAKPPVVHQLFFALRPVPTVARSVAELGAGFRESLGVRSKPLAADRLHITLLDLGAHTPAPEALLALACQAAARLKAAPFDVVFDRVAGFKNSQGNCPLVLRAAPGANPALTAFQLGLYMEAVKLGLKSRLIAVPHITLMYDRQLHGEHLIEPVRWTAKEFLLIDSLQGMHVHQVRGAWSLDHIL